MTGSGNDYTSPNEPTGELADPGNDTNPGQQQQAACTNDINTSKDPTNSTNSSNSNNNNLNHNEDFNFNLTGAPMLADRHYEDGSFQKRNKFADDGHSRRGRGGFTGYAKNAPYQQGGGGAKSFANNRRIPTINSQRGDGSQGGYSERGRGRYNSNNNNNNGRF